MHIGSRIVAPEGFGQLAKETFYHCVDNNPSRANILLVQFVWSGKGHPKAILIKISREDFETAIDEGLIVATEEQPSLPIWLEKMKGKNFWALDEARKNAKISYYERVSRRLAVLAPALESLDKIFDAENVAGCISTIARSLNPKQNETRYSLWLFSYLCFGRNIWALHSPFDNIGHWKRDTLSTQKLGAPSLAYGRHHGYRMTESMRERCKAAYFRYVKPGRKMSDIYVDVVTKEFGCKSVSAGRFGLEVFVHPGGEPFPTKRQFRYQLEKTVGIDVIQINRYGKTRHRNKKAAPEGRYSEAVAYLMERTESDGYFTVEYPKGYIDGETLPALCVVKARDTLSGLELGIGFSLGSEVGSAYRMMLFSMVVPKDFFCMLWGIEEVSKDDWPCEGMPLDIKVDRGPGSSIRLIEDSVKPVYSAMAPSFTPQSKASVESSHPRAVHMQGPPTHVASQMTPVELAKREIRALITRNNTADMSDRMELDPGLAFVPPSASAIWRYYSGRLRNAATPMSIDDAVRAFLTPIELTVTKAGAFLGPRWYYSEELKESGLLQKLARGNKSSINCNGYMLDMCLRHIWLELPSGQLLLLKGRLRTREDESLLDASISEHLQWTKARAIVNSAYEVHKPAFTAKMMGAHEADTGKAWEAGQIRTGKAKRKASARTETQEAKQHSKQGRVR